LSRLIAFHKPYGVLSQFTSRDAHPSLSGFGLPAGVYPVGRLDRDSEGLLLLTADGALQHRLSDPRFGHERTYWVQVERVPPPEALARLRSGPVLRDGPTRPCRARLLEAAPRIEPRAPPVRFRKSVPTAWLEMTLTEGRNRQVRRMTAAVGHPTLRLVRVAAAGVSLGDLPPGRWRIVHE
jgi:23S rRNA pseudouridine2457 synthase